jgi:hypothetical protein
MALPVIQTPWPNLCGGELVNAGYQACGARRNRSVRVAGDPDGALDSDQKYDSATRRSGMQTLMRISLRTDRIRAWRSTSDLCLLHAQTRRTVHCN